GRNDSRRGQVPTFFLETFRLPVAQRPPQPTVARGRLRRCRSSTMRSDIAFVAAPWIRPRGARNAAPHSFSATC
ncbi:MAG TPA: hypothetical protein VKJ00_02290, partial [Thermoanaerobaculia bacterium]|nr:hypothetical protein [Thermoanaerobaculia bacterium]